MFSLSLQGMEETNIALLLASRSPRAALVCIACFSEVVAPVRRDANERAKREMERAALAGTILSRCSSKARGWGGVESAGCSVVFDLNSADCQTTWWVALLETSKFSSCWAALFTLAGQHVSLVGMLRSLDDFDLSSRETNSWICIHTPPFESVDNLCLSGFRCAWCPRFSSVVFFCGRFFVFVVGGEVAFDTNVLRPVHPEYAWVDTEAAVLPFRFPYFPPKSVVLLCSFCLMWSLFVLAVSGGARSLSSTRAEASPSCGWILAFTLLLPRPLSTFPYILSHLHVRTCVWSARLVSTSKISCFCATLL